MNNKKVSLGKLSCFSRASRKKGISAIVATVLIILITVAAVTIIWAAVIPMIRENVEGSAECFDASAALSVVSDYSCYNDTHVKVQVHRGTGDFVLEGIKVQVGDSGNTASKEFNSTTTPSYPDSNEDTLYTIALSELSAISTPDEVGVVAIVKAGNTKKECEGSGMIPVSKCAY